MEPILFISGWASEVIRDCSDGEQRTFAEEMRKESDAGHFRILELVRHFLVS
jgi:hypothetical protein